MCGQDVSRGVCSSEHCRDVAVTFPTSQATRGLPCTSQLTPESPGWGTTFLPCPHVYLRLRLERAPSAASSTRDPAAMLDALAQALNVLHGAAGGAVRLTWMGFVHSGEGCRVVRGSQSRWPGHLMSHMRIAENHIVSVVLSRRGFRRPGGQGGRRDGAQRVRGPLLVRFPALLFPRHGGDTLPPQRRSRGRLAVPSLSAGSACAGRGLAVSIGAIPPRPRPAGTLGAGTRCASGLASAWHCA